ADGELVAQQAQNTGGEVKQRADARIGLTVVIAERAFIVSAQIGQTVVETHEPAAAESFVQLELGCLVFALGEGEAIRQPVRDRRAARLPVYADHVGREASLLSIGKRESIGVKDGDVAARTGRSLRVDQGIRHVRKQIEAGVGIPNQVDLVERRAGEKRLR